MLKPVPSKLQTILGDIAKNLPTDLLEFKTYGKQNRDMATSRMLNVTVPGGSKVPGLDGKVGRLQISFCANWLDIATPEAYATRKEERLEVGLSELDAMTKEQRDKFLAERYAPKPAAPAGK